MELNSIGFKEEYEKKNAQRSRGFCHGVITYSRG